MSSLYDVKFRGAVAKAVNNYVYLLENEGRNHPSDMEIEEYINNIYFQSITDTDYTNALEEDGDPIEWEHDWILEYIDQYSTLYSDYPMSDDEEETED